MRRFRARKRLICTLTDAWQKGVDVAAVYEAWEKNLPARGQTADTHTRPLPLDGDEEAQ
jgi:hypothetical protein